MTTVKLRGITITDSESDTLIYAGEVKVRYALSSLMVKKVVLKKVNVSSARVNISRNTNSLRYDIGEVFSPEAKPEVEVPEDGKKSWEIYIKKGSLSKINFQMNDPMIGIQISEEIEGIKFKDFDLLLRKKSIHLNDVELRGARGGLKPSQVQTDQRNKKEYPWSFSLGKAGLHDLNFTYEQSNDGLSLNLMLEKGLIRTNLMDIVNKEIDIDIISLTQADATILTGRPSKASNSSQKHISESFLWDFMIEKTDFEDVNIMLRNDNHPIASSSTPEFSMKGLDMRLTDTRLNNENTGVEVRKLNFDLNNGFSMKKMKGGLDSNSEATRLDMDIETGNSMMSLEGVADESFFDMIAKPNQIRKALVSLNNTSISPRDISYFKPELRVHPVLKILASKPLILEGDIGLVGSLLNLSEISISQDQNFGITIEGNAKNPFQPLNATGDLHIEIPDINIAWLKAILEGFGFENNVPELTSLSIQGTLSDSIKSPDFNLQLTSNLGNVDLSGSIDLNDDSYAVNTSFDRLMLGELLNIDSLGTVSGSGEFAGTGFNQESMIASISVLVDSISYYDYNYTTASIAGNLSPGTYEFNIRVDDPSLQCDLNTTVNRADSALMVNATATLFAQLNDLHLYKDTLAVESTIEAIFSKTPNAIETEFSFADIMLTTPRDHVPVQPFNASINIDSVQTHFVGNADFFNADLQIDKPIDELGTVIGSYRKYIASFIDPQHLNAATRISYLPEMRASIGIAYQEAMGLFIQDSGLHFDNLDFSLMNRASDQRIQYNIKGAGLKYKMLIIEDLDVTLTDSGGIMNLHLVADNNSLYASPANKLLLTSYIANSQSLTELSVLSKQDQLIYSFEIAAEIDTNNIVLKVPSKQLILNQVPWKMDSPDLMTINLATKTISPELKMHTDSSSLHLLTDGGDGMYHYTFKLSNVTFGSLLLDGMIPGKPAGSISGVLDYRVNEDPQRSFRTDLQFSDVSWSDLSFSLIDVNGIAQSDGPGAYHIDLAAQLDSSLIVMKGVKQEGGNRTIKSEFTSIPIITFQPFVKDHLSELEGFISGNFNISSKDNNEIFRGDLNINDAALRINALNSKFRIPEETVLFSEKKMVFDQFRILDSLDNPLLVDGFIELISDRPATADLEISSLDLQVMNSKGMEKASFYGDIFIDSHLSLKGPLANPVIEGKIILTDGTDIFYRQKEDLSTSESANIVSFVNNAPAEDLKTETPILSQSRFKESSIKTIIEIDPATRISFNLSRRIYNIDLMIQGGGLLNYQMLTNNQEALSGRYEINEGAADLKLVGWPNKSFLIIPGGFIRWDGVIEDPELKFEASNKVRSSYTNPVDGTQRDVDFNIILQLSNHLSELDVLFTIHTTDQYLMSIINTLSPEEQMRQAITILLFENIDLPGISTSTDYMTEQVNQLVSTQLNSLTTTTIKGIDISFGVDSYVQSTESGGEETKTSLSYEVRKSLLKDRAQIEVSGRFNDLNQQSGASDMSLNNISFEYRLDSAGTKYLKVYNEHSYEDVFEGEVIKTGIGITHRKRYRTVSDIWRREKKNRNTTSEGK
jgi:translocation and assembly module TamB